MSDRTLPRRPMLISVLSSSAVEIPQQRTEWGRHASDRAQELGRDHEHDPGIRKGGDERGGPECGWGLDGERVLPEDLCGLGRQHEACDDEKLPGERGDDAEHELGRGEESACGGEATGRERVEEVGGVSGCVSGCVEEVEVSGVAVVYDTSRRRLCMVECTISRQAEHISRIETKQHGCSFLLSVYWRGCVPPAFTAGPACASGAGCESRGSISGRNKVAVIRSSGPGMLTTMLGCCAC